MPIKPVIGAIIQARLTSSRFPRKILELIDGVPVLEHIVNKLHTISIIDKIIIASPHSPECCLNEEIFIGSEEDVLDRYYQAAKKYNLDIIIRITSDCPLVPVYEINRVLYRLLQSDSEFIWNFPNVPDGFDVEAFTFNALEDAWKNATSPEDREHVTPYMKRNVKLKPSLLESPKLSLDTQEDLDRIKEWYGLAKQEYSDYRWDGKLCNQLHPFSFTESST